MIFRPATPGLLVTLAATILLAIVSFGVPLNKSVYFLEASLTYQNINGSITLGTLGYCLTLNNGTSCSSPGVGYEFNPNQLLGNDLGFAQIPDTVVKWLTYVLVLHIVAFGLSAISTLFGLLAHIREISMTCCSSCIAGIASSVAIAAFIFDIVLFFVVKSRVNSVEGVSGAASFGNAVWLTLAAAIALFISECFFSFGRCCISRRPRQPNAPKNNSWTTPAGNTGYAEQIRLDAVKAEADRKARQNQDELGLPSFQEYEITSPLAANIEPQYLEDETDETYRDRSGTAQTFSRQASQVPYTQSNQRGSDYSGGYLQAPPGTRAVDDFYRTAQDTGGNQASHILRQPSTNNVHIESNAASASYRIPSGHDQYLSTGTQSAHQQYPSGYQYGHVAGDSSYHSATSNLAYASNNSQPQNAYGYQYTNTPTQQPTIPQSYQTNPATLQFSSGLPPGPPRVSPAGPRSPSSYHTDFSENPPSYDTGYAQAPAAWPETHYLQNQV